MNLIKDQQLSYRPIDALKLMELETLKTYIETNLANSFIRPFKFFIDAPIFFIQKHNVSFWLYANYQGLNNLIIKRWYLLLLISGFLD